MAFTSDASSAFSKSPGWMEEPGEQLEEAFAVIDFKMGGHKQQAIPKWKLTKFPSEDFPNSLMKITSTLANIWFYFTAFPPFAIPVWFHCTRTVLR